MCRREVEVMQQKGVEGWREGVRTTSWVVHLLFFRGIVERRRRRRRTSSNEDGDGMEWVSLHTLKKRGRDTGRCSESSLFSFVSGKRKKGDVTL
jgi:hypothetical protein